MKFDLTIFVLRCEKERGRHSRRFSLDRSSQPMKIAGRQRWAVSANSKSKAKNSQSAGMTYQLLLMSKGRRRRGVSDIKLDKNVLSPLKESKLNTNSSKQMTI